MPIPPPKIHGPTRQTPCECGDVLRWVEHVSWRAGRRWRQECICGRCGPWRSAPERDPLKARYSWHQMQGFPPVPEASTSDTPLKK